MVHLVQFVGKLIPLSTGSLPDGSGILNLTLTVECEKESWVKWGFTFLHQVKRTNNAQMSLYLKLHDFAGYVIIQNQIYSHVAAMFCPTIGLWTRETKTVSLTTQKLKHQRLRGKKSTNLNCHQKCNTEVVRETQESYYNKVWWSKSDGQGTTDHDILTWSQT